MNALVQHDTANERKTLILLGLGFGLVGLDRWIVAPLFPHMMRDLGLNFQQLGSLIGVLSVAWGIWAIAMGPVSDRIGRKKMLVVTMVAFSLLSSLSGLAASFGSLMLIRAVMGVAEGAFTPASVAATGEASLPSRRGFNQGLQLSMFSLLGLGFAPIIATQLLRIVPSWHWVFMISAVPGLIVAALIAAMLREHPKSALPHSDLAHAKAKWSELFRSRNVLLATVIVCVFTGVFGGMQIYLAQRVHPGFNDFPNVETAFMDVARTVGGSWLFGAMAVILIITNLGSGLTAQAGLSRLLYGMGRDGVLPRRFFAHLSQRSAVPAYNLLLIGTLAFLGCMVLNYERAAELINFGAFLAFMGVNASVMRICYFRADHASRHFFSDLLLPLAGLLFCLLIWWNLSNSAKIAGGIWFAIGLAYTAILTRGFRRTPANLDGSFTG